MVGWLTLFNREKFGYSLIGRQKFNRLVTTGFEHWRKQSRSQIKPTIIGKCGDSGNEKAMALIEKFISGYTVYDEG